MKNEMPEKEKQISAEEIERVIALSNAFGPSGMEEECVQRICREARKMNLGKIRTDSIMNVWIEPEKESDKPVVFLDAHSDEVGLMVFSICDNGMLQVLPLGGWDAGNLQSQPVLIKTANGSCLKAIAGASASHELAENRQADYDSVFIDPGTSSLQETEQLGIAPGDFIVPDVNCTFDENRQLWIGKAFDCRVGCAALLQTMKDIQDKKLAVHVFGLLSSQEEIGGRGAASAARSIHAQACICFEGCPADDIYAARGQGQTAMKKGPMIRLMDRSMITHPKFMQFARRIAREYDIPLQQAVRRGGGTNGGIYHQHNIPSIVIGIPVRYTHSSVCYCAAKDYADAIKLAAAILENLNEEILESFYCWE